MTQNNEKPNTDLMRVLGALKVIAKEYYSLTGKPLGVAGELGELAAADYLGLTLAEARSRGFDAEKDGVLYEIKTRVKREGAKKFSSQRTSRINSDSTWDVLLLVILDSNYELLEIVSVNREMIIRLLKIPGSKARENKKTLSISQIRSVGMKIY